MALAKGIVPSIIVGKYSLRYKWWDEQLDGIGSSFSGNPRG